MQGKNRARKWETKTCLKPEKVHKQRFARNHVSDFGVLDELF